ncbi:MAG: hypothetical protein M3151_09785, partial [Actinomycetota bacterium]|nr:hypothetical protein [Actinomycetota bacterium]
ASTLNAGEAHACSCAAMESTEEAFQAPDAVFSGEAVEIPAERDGVAILVGPIWSPLRSK